MSRLHQWIVASPLAAAAVVAVLVALITLGLSAVLHPDGIAYGFGKLWLVPLTVLISYLCTVLPTSRSREKSGPGDED